MSCAPGENLQAEHHTDLAHAHRGHQLLETHSVAVGAGLAQVAVDDHDPILWPAEGNRALAQRVLTLGTFGVLEHLAQRALAYIQVRLALEVRGGDFVVHLEVHAVDLLWQLKAISVSSWTTSPPRRTGSRGCGAAGVCGTAGASGVHAFSQSGTPAARNR